MSWDSTEREAVSLCSFDRTWQVREVHFSLTLEKTQVHQVWHTWLGVAFKHNSGKVKKSTRDQIYKWIYQGIFVWICLFFYLLWDSVLVWTPQKKQKNIKFDILDKCVLCGLKSFSHYALSARNLLFHPSLQVNSWQHSAVHLSVKKTKHFSTYN